MNYAEGAMCIVFFSSFLYTHTIHTQKAFLSKIINFNYEFLSNITIRVQFMALYYKSYNKDEGRQASKQAGNQVPNKKAR